VRVRELLEPLGCRVCKTVVDDYLREVRPLFLPARGTFQRTIYRPGRDLLVQMAGSRAMGCRSVTARRVAFVVTACLGYSRTGAGILVLSKETETAGRDRRPFDPQAANLMFMLVSRRSERASLIVTSNKPFSV
jgi:hypothetical protein